MGVFFPLVGVSHKRERFCPISPNSIDGISNGGNLLDLAKRTPNLA